MSEEKSMRGALNRARNAKIEKPDADFWIGLEGGVEDFKSEIRAFAWVVVIDKNQKIGKGKTGTYVLQAKIAELIKEGKELGEANAIVLSLTNSKHPNVPLYILTGDVLTQRV